MVKVLVFVGFLAIGILFFMNYEYQTTIPEFTEEQYEAICIEEELL